MTDRLDPDAAAEAVADFVDRHYDLPRLTRRRTLRVLRQELVHGAPLPVALPDLFAYLSATDQPS